MNEQKLITEVEGEDLLWSRIGLYMKKLNRKELNHY